MTNQSRKIKIQVDISSLMNNVANDELDLSLADSYLGNTLQISCSYAYGFPQTLKVSNIYKFGQVVNFLYICNKPILLEIVIATL